MAVTAYSTMTAVTMPNMPLSSSTWGRMWQCQTQAPGLSSLHEHGVALAGGDVHDVGDVGGVEGIAVLGQHDLVELVQVHRVDLRALVEVVEQHPVALLRRDRRGGREALPVEAVADHARSR